MSGHPSGCRSRISLMSSAVTLSTTMLIYNYLRPNLENLLNILLLMQLSSHGLDFNKRKAS